MIVSPDCVCYLVNIDKREVCWQFEDIKERIHESSHDGVDDYLDVGVDEHGRMHIYRHNPLSNTQMESCNLITLNVRDIYGEDLNFTTSTKTLDFQHLRIQRADYEFSMHTWHLKCSAYKASFKNSGVKCLVYHALTPDAFTKICGEFMITRSVKNVPFIRKFPGKRIQICHPKEILYGDLVKGTFEGLDVAVSVIEQANADFSTIYDNNVWSCNGGNNVARLIEVEIQDGRCLLAFEPCQFTFHQYLKHNMVYKSYEYVSMEWLVLFRGLILGIRDLHNESRRCHGNLNTGNILVSAWLTTKLSGFSNSTRLTSDNPKLAEESRSMDMYALGKVLLFWYSEFNFDDMTSTGDDDPLKYLHWIHRSTREGYHIVEKLLGPSHSRPDIDEVFIYPSFWAANERLEFMREVSDQLVVPAGAFLLTPIESILSEVFPAGSKWSSSFSSTLMTEMVNKRRGRAYNEYKVQDLLRFLRNIISHHATIPEAELKVLGRDRLALECTFRQLFPNLLIKVYNVVKDALAQNPSGTLPTLEYYYDINNYLKGY